MSLSQELEARGFIHQIAGPSLATIIDGEQRTIYHGIDPSADSAHAGNFVIWMLLRYLAQGGHKIVFLVGGGTGMIGDPKPDAERELKDAAAVAENVAKLKVQAEKFFTGFEIEFVNNLEWLGELKLIDFLRDIGKHYTVNELIKKDAIATRLSSDTGLSYTEFAYPILQGYDYLQLFETKGCTVQIGGSDQWGNIVSGVELVRRKKQTEVYAVTVPLIIDKATGKKFGKSEGNAVWLDPEKTSPYQFYQFWLNVSDDSVVEHLKRFTFLSLDEIEKIAEEQQADPGARAAQKALALAVTTLVHGEEAARAAESVSGILFGGVSLAELSAVEREMLLANAPSTEIESGSNVVDVLVATQLAASKREARTFVEDGAVSVNGEKVTSVEVEISAADTIEGVLLLKRGKKQLSVVLVR
ncbi:MAG: tyrosine--tRNA ligase [Candidatus Kaiserbacteria bacterium]|nr:tyrosine--tRNA ligase [Candidatus Kaiserbacteria bacterium]MCB9816495.1 tyrosine--tRNA ligase [Candidatus Nomurabacteria bacterium]